jgi:inner membrane protein
MLFFGHIGITLGAGTVLAGLVDKNSENKAFPGSCITSLSHYADIRVLIVGSMLPDIIDKPIGHYIFRSTFSNGRIFSHTLLFLALLAVTGFWLYRSRHQVWLLTLAAGTFVHLVLDGMWNTPSTLFWPAMGFTFAKANIEGWLPGLFSAIFSDKVIFISELIGLIIVLYIGLTLVRRRKLLAFIRSGKVE